MTSPEINFEFTDPIKRYIQDIIMYWNERKQDMPRDKIQFAEPIIIKTYIVGQEKITSEDETNRGLLIKWLQKRNAIEYLDKLSQIDSGEYISNSEVVGYPEVFQMHIRDIRPILELEAIISGDKENSSEVKIGEDHYFYMDTNGDFSFGEKPEREHVLFDNHEDIYYKIFKGLYILGTSGSLVSYESLDKFLVQHGIEKLKHKDSQKRRLKGAINGSLKRRAEKYNLPLKVNGKPVISVTKGKGYKFYNPPLSIFG